MTKLEKIIQEELKNKNRLILAFVGKPGSGKSTIAKNIRKNGIAGINKHKIAVIDDNVMSVDLIFARPKYKNKSSEMDNYEPFFKFIPPWVKIIIIVNPNRLEFADILVKIKINEETRRQRLESRESKNPEKLEKFLQAKEAKYENLKFKNFIELENR